MKHYAWHGGPKHCIRGILECGFLISQTPRIGNRFGHGIYLSTEAFGRNSCHKAYSKPDSSGYQYLLLCEVLPGTAEPTMYGQVRSSNIDRVHSGVDQFPNPTMHIFWSYDMNCRIRPKYLVIIPPPIVKSDLDSLRDVAGQSLLHGKTKNQVKLKECASNPESGGYGM